MLLSWMAYATLVGLLVYGAAAAAERAAATWERSRRLIWIAAVLVAIVSPAILAVRPPSRTASLPIPATVDGPARDAEQSVADGSAPPREGMRARVAHAFESIDPYVGRAWLIASLAWLTLLLRAAIAVRRQRAHWTAVEMDGVHVLVAADVGPAVIGALKPEVVIPRWAFALDASVRKLMLCHETEHIRARDPMLLRGALLAVAAFPWNAALWMIVRRLRLAIEIDCDRRVLRASARRREYGELLLTVGARRSALLPFATSLAERRPSLERRIRAMTMTTPRHPRLVSAACIVLAVAATTAAVRAPRPAPIVQLRHVTFAATSHATIPSGPDSLSVAEIRALIVAHHPTALSGDSTSATITIVVDANGNYVVSAAEGPPANGGRGARGGGNSGAAPGGGFGRARGGSPSGAPSNAARDATPRIVQTQQITRQTPAGLEVKTRVVSLLAVAGDTMELSVRNSTGATTDSERVFRMISTNMQPGGVIRLNTNLLSRMVDPDRVESIHSRAFAAGELGVTPLDVFVVRMKP